MTAVVCDLPAGPAQPLQVTAELRSAIASEGVELDAFLAYVVAQRDDIPPALTADDIVPIEIPIERAPGGLVHLCSSSFGAVEARASTWINRRFPIAEAQAFGEEKFRRIKIDAGAQKSFRIPLELRHMEDDRLVWWCVGDPHAIAELLVHVGALGKRRGVGKGLVDRWTIERCEPWDGFPVLREGRPMRRLPIGFPGLLADVEQAYATPTYPYWNRAAEILCVMPERA